MWVRTLKLEFGESFTQLVRIFPKHKKSGLIGLSVSKTLELKIRTPKFKNAPRQLHVHQNDGTDYSDSNDSDKWLINYIWVGDMFYNPCINI